jgi:hypothetical protein
MVAGKRTRGETGAVEISAEQQRREHQRELAEKVQRGKEQLPWDHGRFISLGVCSLPRKPTNVWKPGR